jgi:protein-S-isoprenylcysteine O-methyltransferase Ste14
MSEDAEIRDGAAVRFPPPFVPLIALAAGGLLHLPWPLAIPLEGAPRFGLGLLLLALGLAPMAAAVGLFRRTGQDPKPWESTPEIISTGIYGRTRNPMYLSIRVLQGGVAVLLANAWIVLLVPVTGWAIQRTAIRHEEAHLEGKFGSACLDYKKAVRHWL